MGVQANAQREIQLLAEWLAQSSPTWKTKTHVRVGSESLCYNGVSVSMARARAFEVWSDWADARVFTGAELWIVEAKLVGTAGAYGQVLDYANQYPKSADAAQFGGYAVIPVVLCAAEKVTTRTYFATFGVRTIVFTPTWAIHSVETKMFGSGIDP